MSKRVTKSAVTVLLFLMMAMTLAGTVGAVHDLELFELDRNAQDGAGGGDDWATLYTGGGSAVEFTGILEDTKGTNPLGSVGTQFQAGGQG